MFRHKGPSAASGFHSFTAAACLSLLVPTPSSTADVVEFEDKDEWIEAVRDFAFIDFVGIPHGTFLSSEFEHLGVTFPPNQNVVVESGIAPDGFTLHGSNFNPISFTFAEPQHWVATDYLGFAQFRLFLGEQLVYESTVFPSYMVAVDFAGFVSTKPFDRVMIHDPTDPTVAIDNLYVGVSKAVAADVNADGVVGVLDLVAVILAWGSGDAAADVNDDGIVGVDDLIEVIVNWS